MKAFSISTLAANCPARVEAKYQHSKNTTQTSRYKSQFLPPENNISQKETMRTASWLGFVTGLCTGISITALLALTILGS